MGPLHRHPRYDLWLHDDVELGELLGAPVAERATVHEWMLSSVQRVRTADGRRYIYKVQAPPTLEPAFYARARSPLLVPARSIPGQASTAVMVMEDVLGRPLSEAPPPEPEAVALAEHLLRGIAEIEGDLPAMTDIGTVDRWVARFELALADIRAFVSDGTFHQVEPSLPDRLGRLAESPAVLDAIRSPCGYVHTDLMANNVLVTADGGHRILDWQRPIRGPVALDAATLLISLGIDATRHVPVGVVQLYHLLHIAWYTECARRWYPEGRPFYGGSLARIDRELQGLPRP